MRFSEAAGRQVVSTSTAATVGKVDGFIVDPQRQAVVALALKKTDSGDTLRWPDITAFGSDAVTVSGVERITSAGADVESLAGKAHQLLGKRVLTSAGEDVGTVDDVEFDSETGTITELLIAKGNIAGRRLLGVGSYAVVVHAQ